VNVIQPDVVWRPAWCENGSFKDEDLSDREMERWKQSANAVGVTRYSMYLV
jgi:hypothetical protein